MPSDFSQRLDAARFKIEDLLNLVRQGKVRVPRFQRPLRWTGSDVEKLFDSVYRGFPIGTLLFWVNQAPREVVELGPVTVNAPASDEAFWVVDGQQRVTSLAATLLPASGAADPRFEISFDLESESFAHRRANDPETKLPIREAFELQRVLTWLRGRNLGSELEDNAFKLADRLRNYEFPAYLVATEDQESLQVIFDRTNTFGKSMTKAEVFTALNTKASSGTSGVKELADRITAMGYGELPGNTLLYAILGVEGPDVTREFRSEFRSDGRLSNALEAVYLAVERTVEFLANEADVPHLSLVPYQHQTVALVRYFALHPKVDPALQVLLRRWFWQSAASGPVPKLGNTGTLRATTTAIIPDDAYGSVERLLQLTGETDPDIRFGDYRWTTADTRITVCALASLGPRDINGNRMDVTSMIERRARDALMAILDIRRGSRDVKSIVNRTFLFSEDDRMSESEILDSLLRSADRTLASHALSPAMVSDVIAGNDAEFLAARGRRLTDLVGAFVASRSERGRGTRPSISSLFDDD